ncbi:low-density lipoprotein receptor-related protein 2-like [Ruditapes philippinarum]|uniref:low-density lipoprotein receptor-related protein 2-like n=1 Tax=Ruditapes philippinarum TaxID=129788 RepID=UPI00295C165E|nr:low-density lipoprotein receptor-related protein 2-like [Ruditapes philippinarum]
MTEKKVPEKKCVVGSSIPKMNWCDRTFDCLDLTDELSCQNKIKDHNLTIIGKPMEQSYLPKRLIREAYFTCEHSKEWISTLAKCDNVIDCLDASDEVNCSHYKIGCDDNEFSCDGGHCIKLSHVCDFISDCADGTDEICEYQKCDKNEFPCDSKQCIPSEKHCNAIPDCLDNSDENNCESCRNSFLCSGDYKCIPLRLICDRYPDCTDSSDELNCYLTIPTSADFSDEYLSLTHWKVWGISFDFKPIGKESQRKISSFHSPSEMDGFQKNGYSCFFREKTYCQLKYREAAVVDNFNDNFAYPFCNCTEEKSGFIEGTICDGTEIDWNISPYLAQNVDTNTIYDFKRNLQLRHFKTRPLMMSTI